MMSTRSVARADDLEQDPGEEGWLMNSGGADLLGAKPLDMEELKKKAEAATR